MRSIRLIIVFIVLAPCAAVSFSQTAPEFKVTSASLLQYLNRTIGWYRQLDAQRQIVTDSEEAMTVNENQRIVDQVALLAFEFARAEAELIEKEEVSAQAGSGDESGLYRYHALRRTLTSLDQQVLANQRELESLEQMLANSTGAQRETLQHRIAEIQSELGLAQVRRESLKSMADFVGGSSADGLGATGIREKIEALARTVPAVLAGTRTGKETAVAGEQTYPAAGVRRSAPAGIWGLTADLFALSARMQTLRGIIEWTDTLSQDSRTLRTPLVSTMRELSKQGDELASRTDTTDPIFLIQEKAMLDALTAQFKRTSASFLPLSKQGILLEVYRKNLANWQSALAARHAAELNTLLIRLGFLLAFLTVVIGGAALWRRAIFRFVRDPRRRYQYLLIRKIVFGCVIAVALIFSFASELGSVATFAGLITAGIAVALQSVILSVVGYFFLIGKYGIRVGDRVQVAGITGEVMDIGLVRFHMLELVSGGEKTASGRVVAVSNSVVFQANQGFFKQIPGTDFVWHEVTLAVPPDVDYGLVEKRLLGVVTDIYSEYREEMEKQYRHMEKTLANAPVGALQPASRLQLTPSGLEISIRYPVDLVHASEIDDRVTRELLSALDREPGLKAVDSGKPPLRLKTEISG